MTATSSFLALFDLIGVLARRRYRAGERAFSAVGLNHTEARLLVLLNEKAGVASQEVLSKSLLVDRSNAGRALKRLHREGYVTRQTGESDKRTNIVRITSKGRRTVSEIAKLRKKIAERFFGDLTSEDAATVVRILNGALAAEETRGKNRRGVA